MVCFLPPKQPINLSGWELPDHVLYDILKLSGGIGTHRAAAAYRTVSILLRRYPKLRHVKAPLDFEVPAGATVMTCPGIHGETLVVARQI